MYPNLARLDRPFEERGMNYTGIPLEGWGSPTVLLPPVLLTLLLVTAGRPRGGWLAWWNLINIVLIHPMDL